MVEEEVIKALDAYIAKRIPELELGGRFQAKPLAELYLVRDIINKNRLTPEEVIRRNKVLAAPPIGTENAPDPKVRAKEIYDEEIAKGNHPEHHEGGTDPMPKPDKKPCKKKENKE